MVFFHLSFTLPFGHVCVVAPADLFIFNVVLELVKYYSDVKKYDPSRIQASSSRVKSWTSKKMR